jgi:hypothetical protein
VRERGGLLLGIPTADLLAHSTGTLFQISDLLQNA